MWRHEDAGSRIAFSRLCEDVTLPGSHFQFDLGATWSPDGRTIAFYGIQFGLNALNEPVAIGPPHVFLFDMATRSLHLSTPMRGRFPSWSPDGRQIAFTSRPDGNDEIYVMNADGSPDDPPLRLTFNSSADNAADWSPDGRRIVFQSRRDGNDEIYVMNADGGGVRRLDDLPGTRPGCGLVSRRAHDCLRARHRADRGRNHPGIRHRR